MAVWKKILVSGSNISELNNNIGYATTGSNTFQGNQTINGNVVVTGSLTALQYIVSSSVIYVTESNFSGSHVFGNSLDDTHQFTGSVYITGSLTSPDITGSLFGTASWATQALTASYTPNALTTASVSLNTITFTKGDGSTFPITVDTGSGGGITIPGDGNQAIQFNSASVFSGSTNLKFDYVNNNIILTGSLLVTQSHISTVDYIDFTTVDGYPHNEGRLHWTNDTKTLQIDTDKNGFMIEVGHQNVVRVYNDTGADIALGKVVRISGSQGNQPTIVTASWDDDQSSATTLGFTATLISGSGGNRHGYVITNGLLRNVNTNGFTVGTQLYLSSSGDFTSTPPDAPLHEVRLGKVIVSNATTGVIYVDIMNGYELTELHDVKTNGVTNGDLLMYSSSLWINSKTLTGSYTLSGSLTTNDGVQVQSLTASFVSASSITGSLFGTSSWASQALTASFLPIGTYNITSSWAAEAVSADNVRTPSVASLVTLGSTIKAEPLWGGFQNVTGASLGLTNQRLLLSPVFIHETTLITGVKWVQVATGSYTPNNYNGVALYSLSAGTLTNIASSSNAGTTWSTFAANSMGSASFGSTVTINAGLYYIGILWSRSAVTTVPTIGTAANTNTYAFDFTNSSKAFCFTDANTSMPTSIAMSAATAAAQTPYLVLF